MAGTPRGSIEHFISGNNAAAHQDMFMAVVDFLEAHPSWTSIASQGNGATGAPSTWGWSGGANVPGENAWVVFEHTDGWFVLLQWSWASAFGASPGDPGDAPAGYYLGIQMAFDTSGGTSIWNGGTGNAGVDSKGTPVWVNDGGQVVVYPRGNGAGGTFNTNKEACASVNYGGTTRRFHVVGDDDYLWFGTDQDNNGDYNSIMYLGPYTPDDDVTPVGAPLVMYQQENQIADFTSVGTAGNTSSNTEGGVVAARGQAEARSFNVPIHGSWMSATYQPNGQRDPAGHDLLDLPLVVSDAQGDGSYGYLGKIELVQCAFNVPTHDTNGDASKAFFGYTTNASNHWVVDWDGATVPGTGTTRSGIQFP